MRARLENFLKNIDDFIFEDLVDEAQEPIKRVFAYYYDKGYTPKDAFAKVFSMVSTAIKLDREITQKELFFVDYALNFNLVNKILIDAINNYALSEYAFEDEYDSMPYYTKVDLIVIIICTCGSDGNVNGSEMQFLKKLIRNL